MLAGLTNAPSHDIRSLDATSLALDGVYGFRPRLRGRFHQLGALASVPAGLSLVLRFTTPTARLAAIAYALTWFLMFATSASYHRLAQSVTARFWMRRLDHSMIFVHISGALTPIALLAVGGRAGLALLVASWTGTLIGVAIKLTQLTIDHDPFPYLIPLMGWLPLVSIPWFVTAGDIAGLALLLSSTLIYAAGGVCFRFKRPNPAPTVFGYHEVFHCSTLAAGACQFGLTLHLVTSTTAIP